MKKAPWIAVGMMLIICMSMVRYPVGQPVPMGVYTEPFSPEDGIYKFMQIVYLSDPNDPNSPKKVQAAPDDWISAFGNNERTMLFHTLSELRVIVAQQGNRLINLELRIENLEKWQEAHLQGKIPDDWIELWKIQMLPEFK